MLPLLIRYHDLSPVGNNIWPIPMPVVRAAIVHWLGEVKAVPASRLHRGD